MLFYRALSAGAMTVVAPVTGVTSAAIPVVAGLVWGERPSGARLLGVGCALLAIALVSIAPHPPGRAQVVSWRLVAVALGSGVGLACSSSCSPSQVTPPEDQLACGRLPVPS